MKDLSEVDSQLRFSAILPDFQTWLDRMEEDSGSVDEKLGLLQHAYGPNARQWVELAEGSGSAQIVPVFIHGGYWRSLAADNHRFVLPTLAQMGIGVASLEYRLMPTSRMADLVADTVAGLQLIARQFPGAKLLPIGHSAGAHLGHAALALDIDIQKETAGFVSISGVFDLSLIAASFLQDELKLTADEIVRFSVTHTLSVPSLFIAGSQETEPFRQQAKALGATSGFANTMEIDGAHHMNILHACLTGPAPLISILDAWLAGHTAPERLEAFFHDPPL